MVQNAGGLLTRLKSNIENSYNVTGTGEACGVDGGKHEGLEVGYR